VKDEKMNSITKNKFTETYGPWALIAGASDGLGESFARYLANQGINLVLIARRKQNLDAIAAELAETHKIDVKAIQQDLSDPSMLSRIDAETNHLDVNLLIYVASDSSISPFLDKSLEDHLKIIDLSCKGPLLMSYHFGHKMKNQGKGGIILLSSLACYQGAPMVASYAATKAFNLILGESLWDELAPYGVDVITIVAGSLNTPQTRKKKPIDSGYNPPLIEPDDLVRETFQQLGRKASHIPGMNYRISNFILGNLFSRKQAIRKVGKMMRRIYNIEY
jgi:short-subunit dehydrogenase